MSTASLVTALIGKLRVLLRARVGSALVEHRGYWINRCLFSNSQFVQSPKLANCSEMVRSVQSLAYEELAAIEPNEGQANTSRGINITRSLLTFSVAVLCGLQRAGYRESMGLLFDLSVCQLS